MLPTTFCKNLKHPFFFRSGEIIATSEVVFSIKGSFLEGNSPY